MSLDGYIAGPNDTVGNPGGDGFMRLHDWYGFVSTPGAEAKTVDKSGLGAHFLDEVKETGAVLSGRNTAEQSDHWGGDHHRGCEYLCSKSSATRSVRGELSLSHLCQ